jgi:DNA-binding NarL/FixJ family response regulator
MATDVTTISDFASNPTEMTVKIAIVEDRREILDGLARLISQTEGFIVSGSYSSMEAALAKLPNEVPDILLSDIGLPGISGIEGVRILKDKFPNLKVLMLSVYDDNDRIIEAICAGASGYLLKNTSPLKLIASIKDVLSGGAPMSPEIASKVLNLFRRNPPPKQVDYNLTPHETRLLKMLIEGHNYKTAAAALSLSVNTISFHMRHIYEKLQVHSKSEAVAKALKSGLFL